MKATTALVFFFALIASFLTAVSYGAREKEEKLSATSSKKLLNKVMVRGLVPTFNIVDRAWKKDKIALTDSQAQFGTLVPRASGIHTLQQKLVSSLKPPPKINVGGVNKRLPLSDADSSSSLTLLKPVRGKFELTRVQPAQPPKVVIFGDDTIGGGIKNGKKLRGNRRNLRRRHRFSKVVKVPITEVVLRRASTAQQQPLSEDVLCFGAFCYIGDIFLY